MNRAAVCAVLWAVMACETPAKSPDAAEAGRGYVDDPAVGRAVLEASLVNRSNTYSRRRLENYRPEAWGALPLWLPSVSPVRSPMSGGPAGPTGLAQAWAELDLDAVPYTDEALRELGARAFHGYPVQLAPALRGALNDPKEAESLGLFRDGDNIGGLVWVDLPSGAQPALTCATCHASPDMQGGARGLVDGRTHPAFDYGRALHQDWGPGRVDVTSDDRRDPIAIPDLRPIRFQTHLHRAGTVRNGLLELAVRIETLYITSLGEGVRPPRKLALALAWYLGSLADTLPEPPTGPGADLFASNCARCHSGEGLAGGLVSPEKIGTDARIALSPDRGTGSWRIPSLRGVGDRSPLLASGDVYDVEDLLDPDRSVPGHTFGHALAASERQALLGFLKGL